MGPAGQFDAPDLRLRPDRGFSHGFSDQGEITITPLGIGGTVAAGTSGETQISVNVGGDGFEYIGYKIALTETVESGITATQRGGPVGPNPGLWARLRFAWDFIWNGFGALVPTLAYSERARTTTRSTQAGWKICRKPCG